MAKCLNILEIVFGAWVLLSVPLLGCASAAPAVDLMAGALIVVLAGVSTGMKEYNPGCDWALVFVGCAFAVWGIADAAASLGGAPVNEIIFGLLVALVAFGATRFTTVYDGASFYDRGGAPMVDVKSLRMKDDTILMKALLLQSMPSTVYVRPDEVWKVLTMIPLRPRQAAPRVPREGLQGLPGPTERGSEVERLGLRLDIRAKGSLVQGALRIGQLSVFRWV